MKTSYLRVAFTAIALSIPAAFTSAQAVLAEAVSFELINNSSQDVWYLYVSPSSNQDWGEDILGEDILFAGESAEVVIDDGLTTCEYDLLAVSDTEAELEDYNLDLCEMTSYTITD
jgi:hypothetical protein